MKGRLLKVGETYIHAFPLVFATHLSSESYDG